MKAVMLQFDMTHIPVFVLLVIGLLIGTFGIGSFYTTMLPFALDQMIGASAEEISATVQWYCWGFDIALLLKDVLQCVPIPNQPPSKPRHSSSDLPHFRHSMFISCSDNGLPVPQVARH